MSLQLGDVVPDFTQDSSEERFPFMSGQEIAGLYCSPIPLTIRLSVPRN
jgi:hypothetical protein